MQETEKELETKNTLVPADRNSQPLPPVPLPEGDAQDDDPDEIFLRAVAEIDTQPLVTVRKPLVIHLMDIVQVFFCSCLILGSLTGIIWQAITYPKMLVILYTVEKPATLTTTLDIPTRTLAPVTLTRTLTTPTTGKGYQDAQAANGSLTFYNGQLQSVSVPSGSLFTGRDGEQIVTTQDAIIPAADPSTTPPTYGQTTVLAQALQKGAHGNIPTFDLSGSCCAPSVIVKNLTSFHNGQDARNYQAVAPQDLTTLTSAVQKTLDTAFTTAFPVRPGETLVPTNCHTTAKPNHQAGDESQTVTLNGSETCSAIAYSQSQLQAVATQLFTTQTAPGKHYKLVGSLTATIVSVTPLTVSLLGSWVYVLSSDEQESLAQAIQGETPAQARKYLLSTGVISSASVPDTLPAALYINFLVLVGK